MGKQKIRILVANEPRAYREVIAGAFQALRPQVEVLAIEPADLDAAVMHLTPEMVVCSRVSTAVQKTSVSWVLLYPEGTAESEMSIAGKRSTLPEIDFDNLLHVLDETERLQI